MTRPKADLAQAQRVVPGIVERAVAKERRRIRRAQRDSLRLAGDVRDAIPLGGEWAGLQAVLTACLMKLEIVTRAPTRVGRR